MFTVYQIVAAVNWIFFLSMQNLLRVCKTIVRGEVGSDYYIFLSHFFYIFISGGTVMGGFLIF